MIYVIIMLLLFIFLLQKMLSQPPSLTNIYFLNIITAFSNNVQKQAALMLWNYIFFKSNYIRLRLMLWI